MKLPRAVMAAGKRGGRWWAALASLACVYEGGPHTVIKAGAVVASG